MQYQAAVALKDEQDIQCVQSIFDSMSLSFFARVISPAESGALSPLLPEQTDLLILDLDLPDAEALAPSLRREKPGLWMILLQGRKTNPMTFCRERRSILLQKPVSTMRMLHALHSAAAGLEQERGKLS